ncbi:N-acetylglucosamine kinase [Rahnella sp. C60]|uniref:N-acetylglucosamine kinase n=1 Tax=Rahnella perminowiae TaxID=2816244 RepID=A0ABS6L2B7_9GAMM|nr:BadF/BadG/BcrA/BcrD ATPase family protein [Rahnella perminowiae]UJD89276.1 N-acetylglucosamine kinase [Rahnella aquatilis]MBU9808696.1 N-acetylglucosamine kinase [Rahnella perminowiae]MBU9817724.1 N-acetylglucosamine kinase [Rahnella perminowiae]MBU9828193.1 N-acetylglucosamine kinase [Rahnella perminowiae]MBU9835981.1 N-acetylglucosamine kinase [Rahnella perminowiae]
MQPEYFVGIDAGGTQCRARLTDHQGNVLAHSSTGSANIFSDFKGAIDAALSAVENCFSIAELPAGSYQKTAAAFGFAGANVTRIRQQALDWPMPFLQRDIASDVEIACLGAHAGQPGAVLIVGTGSQGTAYDGQHFHSVGGWGFALSDGGSGAQLGRSALRLALRCHEGLSAPSPLTDIVMAYFDNSPENMLQWTLTATPAQWGTFAPWVFEHAARQDSNALSLVHRLAADIGQHLSFLVNTSQAKVCLMGGIAQPVTPYLSPKLQQQLVAPQGDALQGALLLAAHHQTLVLNSTQRPPYTKDDRLKL